MNCRRKIRILIRLAAIAQPLAEDFPGSRINQVDSRTDHTSQRLEGSFAVFGWAAVLSWAVRDEALDVVAVHDGVNYGCLLNV